MPDITEDTAIRIQPYGFGQETSPRRGRVVAHANEPLVDTLARGLKRNQSHLQVVSDPGKETEPEISDPTPMQN